MIHPLFSCVIPVKGARPYFEAALASLRSQGMSDDLEIVVQDGDVEPDAGQSDALNKGFAKARGEWLFWLNSDDILLPGALKKVAALIERGRLRIESEISHVHSIEEVEKHREGGVLFRLRPRQSAALPNGDGGFAIASTPTTNNYTSLQWIAGNEVYIDSADRILWCAWERGWRWAYDGFPVRVYGPSSFFRRALFEQAGGFDASCRFSMDTDLWCRFRQAGWWFCKVPAYLWGFRVHTGSLTSGDLLGQAPDGMEAEQARIDWRYGVTRGGWAKRKLQMTRLIDGSYAKSWLDTRRWKGRVWREAFGG